MVLFRVRDDVGAASIAAAVTTLHDLGRHVGVVSWAVERSLDERKGVIIAQDGTFADAEAFREWRSSDAHREAADQMARISDWWVADWEQPAT
ncbi:hypothetical protein FHS07_002291 [Microbacterium proteolyticum]|uniref:Stress-response A/B barrel domain-containing protein n=1 Tax=Microbacterium proteolyticum TaxID=1572644 RepID=A0A7W5CJY6_9MICO|nr:hypothetical protein [Microbacterium proteolyticum]